jgi:hypothetical protein
MQGVLIDLIDGGFHYFTDMHSELTTHWHVTPKKRMKRIEQAVAPNGRQRLCLNSSLRDRP